MSRTRTIIVGVIVVTTVIAIAALIVTADVHMLIYKGKDMEPTIGQNTTVVITKRVGNIKRGDIVLFNYPHDASQVFVKRVVALPGEFIEIRDGRVAIDQKPLEELYLADNLNQTRRSFPGYYVPARSYYVLGDNRDSSNDSRFWGVVSADQIYAKVILK